MHTNLFKLCLICFRSYIFKYTVKSFALNLMNKKRDFKDYRFLLLMFFKIANFPLNYDAR